ncbi:hypothetical protein LPY66_09605 [Dehalobacter sp. DCM]|uniref:DVU_1557 family redox protein n=1 Tax=Dehalobacter sp. DCM TaxID=2907827 RepID=UPI00308183A2|nr:hypothetical protein LPY66_09605 [Dehalobacter sp. DCM]
MAEKENDSKVICCQCKIPLEISKVSIAYEGHTLSVDLPKCPLCSQVYLSEEIVRTRVHEIEKTLEDK